MEMNRYRLSRPLKDGMYVAALTFEQAIKLAFPDTEVRLIKETKAWAQYETPENLSPTWPRENIGDVSGHGGRIVEVEKVGTILVSLSALEKS
jgi:hypothetical protein